MEALTEYEVVFIDGRRMQGRILTDLGIGIDEKEELVRMDLTEKGYPPIREFKKMWIEATGDRQMDLEDETLDLVPKTPWLRELN